jgi:7-cyano-7-deazaguanine synthase in queuosine biosynthesis
MISLASFRVLRKLSIKNIRLEPKKVKALYQVEGFAGDLSSFELIYSYEHAYFDHSHAADVNLASMMLAQAALNYGLFFEIIVFDRSDQKFIKDMMENTSREILTNKLLVKNEFLKPPFDELKPEKRDHYTQARLHFLNTQYQDLKLSREEEKTDPDKYAILSSGGKDSLLTYGLVKEFGEPYPIFINEAGRHWFTAVNAHRFFQENEANTEKPWCNSDRLFNWMLKQLPFIKENFASIRSDMYPIRLWTVAVFLFGVLPVARKKGIGNILIGDEYDSTLTGNLQGITHYSGLYDQSKYFDNAMTRYYRSKGWGIKQFSILRSMSELLIMKVLIKRYPDLQKHQVSCHAAHEVHGRMHPCGKCEKCRRIIGMLKALDENPEGCGYGKVQIEQGLKALESQSVKQIGSDASHLYHLLLEKNLIARNPFSEKVAREHAEITKLRFDNERSRLEDLPGYVRKPLFDILVQYADGAVKRENRQWIDVKVDEEFLNEVNYTWDEK